jgi:hypothetical protein
MSEILSPSPKRRYLVEWSSPARLCRRYYLHLESSRRTCRAHCGATLWVPAGRGWRPYREP